MIDWLIYHPTAQALQPELKPVVFTDSVHWTKVCTDIGVTVFPVEHANPYGTPILRYLYMKVEGSKYIISSLLNHPFSSYPTIYAYSLLL